MKITFCINTAKNEKDYVQLLLTSLLNGIDVNLHDIVIFVDSDNQNTTEMLLQQKELFPNLTIIKNEGDPVGYAGNINYMFSKAKTDIVSYLQSDMVVGLEYDKRILDHIRDGIVLSSTRVEPPLHALHSNNVNHVANFGFTPEEFQYESFLKFAESNRIPFKNTNYFFAPFSLYKHVWNDIGGHDVSFKKSREDSDIALRLCLNRCELIQTWDAMVYHFSCTSSRGLNWWKKENAEGEKIRQANDAIELQRFISKWKVFMHPTSYSDVKDYAESNPDSSNKIIVKNPPLDESKFRYL